MVGWRPQRLTCPDQRETAALKGKIKLKPDHRGPCGILRFLDLILNVLVTKAKDQQENHFESDSFT